MRNLVFALILVNLGFAAWARWHATGLPGLPAAERESGDVLLASEFDDAGVGLETIVIDETVPGANATGQTAIARTVPAADTSVSPDEDPLPGASIALAGLRDSEPAVVAGDEEVAAGEAATELPGPAAAASLPGSGDLICTSVGPFRELSQVTAAASNLRADGFSPRQRAGEGDIWAGYWVYLERIASVAEAQTMMQTLNENGIADAYVIPDSDSGTLISLGVFSEIIRASRITDQVRSLGFDATIADRVRRATVYWIDVDVADGQLLDFERLQPAGRIIRLEQRPCGEVDL